MFCLIGIIVSLSVVAGHYKSSLQLIKCPWQTFMVGFFSGCISLTVYCSITPIINFIMTDIILISKIRNSNNIVYTQNMQIVLK